MRTEGNKKLRAMLLTAMNAELIKCIDKTKSNWNFRVMSKHGVPNPVLLHVSIILGFFFELFWICLQITTAFPPVTGLFSKIKEKWGLFSNYLWNKEFWLNMSLYCWIILSSNQYFIFNYPKRRIIFISQLGSSQCQVSFGMAHLGIACIFLPLWGAGFCAFSSHSSQREVVWIQWSTGFCRVNEIAF